MSRLNSSSLQRKAYPRLLAQQSPQSASSTALPSEPVSLKIVLYHASFYATSHGLQPRTDRMERKMRQYPAFSVNGLGSSSSSEEDRMPPRGKRGHVNHCPM